MSFRDQDEQLPFADRAEAGRILGAKLLTYSGRGDVLALGLPRGGVPVAFEVARMLHVPLDVLVVRKLGTPWEKELAVGAIASGGVEIVDYSIAKEERVPSEVLRQVAATERKELERQELLYRGSRGPLALDGKTVILVDDGIATGSCILAAIAAVRRQAARVVVAVPVAPAAAARALRSQADEVITVAEPEDFLAVSQWYENFNQISDDEVRQLLASSEGRPRAA
ncbi:MAG TPA: phosphoribosyltransferase family protein [Terriglobales bacterium]|nr:phosphoribosyltransferase family protein [Terriglobales bacterium]